MQMLARLGIILLSPYLIIVYWRNSIREVGDIHANYDLHFE
jgi:hypothetical protein